MRFALILLTLSGTTAQAWEFTPGLPCLLTHETAEVQVTLTHDPTGPLYSITLTRTMAWPDAPLFAIDFQGGAALRIATDRHEFGQQGTAVTVTDRGFGNVLRGLALNETAIASLGDQRIAIPLRGAAEPVEAFRRCAASAGV